MASPNESSSKLLFSDFLFEYFSVCEEYRLKEQAKGSESGLLTICAAEQNSKWCVSANFTGMERRLLSLTESAHDPVIHGGVTVDLTSSIQREFPEAKMARWTQDRIPVEAKRNVGATETILCRNGDDGEVHLLEGLISNVYVWTRSHLLTAPSGSVLTGSMSCLVDRLAPSLGVSVFRESPKLSDCNSWDAMFLTSATKPIVPVREILNSDGNVIRKFPNKLPDLLSELLVLLRLGLYTDHDKEAAIKLRQGLRMEKLWYDISDKQSLESLKLLH